MQSGLMIVHGNHLEELRSLAVNWMRQYPLAPLESEVILVQSNGIAQWLKLALAADVAQGGCGIAAAIDVQLPSRFLWQTYRLLLGEAAVATQSPLDKEPLTWRLLRLLPSCLSDPLFSSLKQFLMDDSEQRKRYQLAERLADLFDQYQVYRSDWLQEWLVGKDQLSNEQGQIKPVPTEQQWQPALWRRLLADLGEQEMQGSRAGVHQCFMAYCQRLKQAPQNLPKRISIFGISALPAQMVDALAVLAKFTQIIFYIHNPCRYYWLDIVEGKQLLQHQYKRQAKKVNKLLIQDLHQFGHPLLAAWGKQGRDYINLLDSYDDPERYQYRFGNINGGKVDLFTTSNTQTLLGQLQDDILELRSLPETRAKWPVVNLTSDHSIRFHIAHSPQREVEILHDQLLDLFNQDPSLRPSDIIVMVPVVDKYVPHVQAVFGQLDKQDKRYIPYTISDRGKRGVEPLLIALEYVLNLPDSRFTVTDILDLLDVPAIRKRFNWQEEHLPILHRWINEAGIRWGLDAKQRQSLGLASVQEQNSWLFGLRRMLLGYAVGSGESWQNIEPFDEIGGNNATLIGELASLIAILDEAHQQLAKELLPLQWVSLLRQLMDLLFDASNEIEQVLLVELANSLDEWLTLCDEAGLNETLPLNIVREAWLSNMDKARLSQNFIAGAVNFCTLMPMRAIPFKVICLLGMNDGDYPRPTSHIDFDLMAKDYRPGDRSRREDDRYLLLEALLSARQRLYISWVGRNIRDNSEKPPSVLIGQLRDHLASGWQLANGDDLLYGLTQVHPLQPFSRRYFVNANQWFSYADEWSGVYQHEQLKAITSPLPFFPVDNVLALEELANFLKHPVRYFFSQRLKVTFAERNELIEDNEPFSLTALQIYQITDNLLQNALLVGGDKNQLLTVLNEQIERLQQSGQLPLAGFGQHYANQLLTSLIPLLEQHSILLAPYKPVENPLPIHHSYQDLSVQGWLTNFYRTQKGYISCFTLPTKLLITPKVFNWRQLIMPWITFLTANATQQTTDLRILALDGYMSLPAMVANDAKDVLNKLLTHWQTGMQQPLPVAIKTSFAWLAETSLEAAQKVYEGNDFSYGECQQSRVLVRQYPNFAVLNNDSQFEVWSNALYQTIYQAPWVFKKYSTDN